MANRHNCGGSFVEMSVKKSTLDTFVKRGGYEEVKYSKRKKKWRGISGASKRTGLARPTIYLILAQHPEAPDKTKPKYVATFEESQGYKLLNKMFGKKLSASEWSQTVKDVRDAWLFLGGSSTNKLDPVSWGEKEFTQIWSWEKFIDPLARGFEEHHGTKFHRLMRAIGRHDLLAKFPSKKRPAGLKKQWFLHDPDIIALMDHINTPDGIIYILRGVCEGARSSALIETQVKDIDFVDHTIQVFESKTRQYVLKYPPNVIFQLLARYVKDNNLKPDDRLCPSSYTTYNKALRNAGQLAKLGKTLSTHILKHTFVTQASRHGVSAETIEAQTGTDWKTLKNYYRAGDEKKIRHELQGAEYDVEPFNVWVERLAPVFEHRYDQLLAGASPQ